MPLVAVTIAMLVLTLFGPSASMALTGDSYQWIQHGHAGANGLSLLLTDFDTSYRPSTTWMLVVDRGVVWGGFEALRYRTSSLIMAFPTFKTYFELGPHIVAKIPAQLAAFLFLLIDAAALFEWTLADEGMRVEHVTDWTTNCAGEPGRILVHRDGGFVDLGTTPNLANEAKRWQSSGHGF